MARRLGLALATFLLLGVCSRSGGAATGRHAPANDDCLACHGDPDAKRENGTAIGLDDKVFAASTHGPLDGQRLQPGHDLQDVPR